MSSRFSSIEDLLDALGQWLDIPGPLQSRHFLEQHPELIASECGTLVALQVYTLESDPIEYAETQNLLGERVSRTAQGHTAGESGNGNRGSEESYDLKDAEA